ncbi:hypothetical protein ACDP63_14390 [Paracoccus sp. P2]|uniref:Uncharacterized protein n=1 Tax=Paracoccus pantotrophus TaxID=82367 RepID=A0A1I5HJV1_PARPN|nr:hypothetical protein [Paracoccus pantotrophus]MDF3854698.1 hypothetical protein [Paracoccus pantotrophus]QFG38207.1 hypothetical protein ESD82_19405 [Paracoccus pantotrophus]QLH15744.1 hypothetical protein HYQ43_16470 [Paracoccus pantotrophus]RDD95933.1 hypothetical protein DTW92_15115 [Paracoccus pantotrophus]RKS51282.1 hypothetical protein BDE18_0522 [Paracoccus pantotrophus]
MTRQHEYSSATELPPELISIGSLNAYEIATDDIRVACRLSDPNYEIGQLVMLDISMTSFELRVEHVADQFFMGYHAIPHLREVLVEIGGYVRSRDASGWRVARIESSFLRDAFVLENGPAFVFGNRGEIFRMDAGGAWSRDATGTDSTIYAMHGTSAETLHAVGGKGTFLRAQGREWQAVELGIGDELRCVRQVGDRIFVGGEGGFAAELRDSELRLIATGIESDILSIACFRDQIYFSDSDFGLHRLAGDAFVPVAELGYVCRLNATPRWLTLDAGEFVFQFDGTHWRGIEITYRDGYRAEGYDMSFLGTPPEG